jgi:hypothetical protein
MASKGYGYNKMARALEGTPTPNTYFMLKNPDYYKKPRWQPNHTWNNKSLFVILNNPIYLGNTVYGKTRIAFVGSNELLQNPQERWITAENTHEPIITQDLWGEAHAVMSVRRRATDESKEPHLFAGLKMRGLRLGAHVRQQETERGQQGRVQVLQVQQARKRLL